MTPDEFPRVGMKGAAVSSHDRSTDCDPRRTERPICESSFLADAIDKHDVPVHRQMLYSSRTGARAAVRGHLMILACMGRGIEFNGVIPLNPNYSNEVQGQLARVGIEVRIVTEPIYHV